MKIIAISDSHLQHWHLQLPPGDVLVHAGDALSSGRSKEWQDFCEWWHQQPHRWKIYVAGNHDRVLEDQPTHAMSLFNPSERNFYLQDTSCIINGVKFYGVPHQRPFHKWAFNRSAEFREAAFAAIPLDTDVLITHTPPQGLQDVVDGQKEHLGDEFLAMELKSGMYANIKLHVFGHIHSGYGTKLVDGRLSVNAAHVNEGYKPTNPPVTVLL